MSRAETEQAAFSRPEQSGSGSDRPAGSRNESVLVVDDEDFVRDSLADLLAAVGFRVFTARGKAEALETLAQENVCVLVSDLRMPRGDGLSLLASARADHADVPVILLTGVGSIAEAVAAMKAGAFDFLEKPIEPEQFVHIVERALEHRALVNEVRYLRGAIDDLRGPTEMVGASAAIERVRALARHVARTDATVLVTGESGTGKELVAAEVHRASHRAARNLVRVNCAAVTETLFESEFFGHRRGSFTGAVADRAGRFAEAEGGTLVLDEIGTLRTEMQAKLLRILETGEYQVVGESKTRLADVRVIAMTNEKLEERVAQGEFRADLYYRLKVFPIAVPPLRERREDLPALCEHFLERLVRGRSRGRGAGDVRRVSVEGLAALQAYEWPGNVRELRNVLERAVILSPGAELDGPLLREILGLGAQPGGVPAAPGTSGEDLHLRRRIEALERELVERALERSGGRKAEAASLLGIDPKNLSYYLRKHAESASDEDPSEERTSAER